LAEGAEACVVCPNDIEMPAVCGDIEMEATFESVNP
jgi:hypothetical protein